MTENQEQIYFVRWLERNPLTKGRFCHVPNERSSLRERHHLASMGVRKGVPDLLLFVPSGSFVGMAVEMKIVKSPPSAVTKEQKEWLKMLGDMGWHAIVARGHFAAIQAAMDYLDLGRHEDGQGESPQPGDGR